MNIEIKQYNTKQLSYSVYSDGRVFNNKTQTFVSPRLCGGYYWIGGIKLHRLIAELFLPHPNDPKMKCLNHIDGNKLNNDVSNLEWCTYYYNNKHARENNLNNVSKSNHDKWKDEAFRQKTSRNISLGQLKSGCNKGKNNPNFRYLILDANGKEYSRQELAQLIGLSSSFTDTLIKKYSEGKSNKYFDKFGISIIDTKKGQSTIERHN